MTKKEITSDISTMHKMYLNFILSVAKKKKRKLPRKRSAAFNKSSWSSKRND